jgi:quercetin dioxygenase-like cupin family protein
MADGPSSSPSDDKKSGSCPSWEDLPLNRVTPFKSFRTFKGENIKVLLLTLSPGHRGEKHKHDSEQISHILKGKIKVRIGGELRTVKAGDLVHIPRNQPHQTEVLDEETVILEIFSPAEYQKVILE